MTKHVETVDVQKINSLIENSAKEFTHHNKKLTVAAVTLESGFMLTGVSYCADAALFKEDKGEEYAIDNVREKLWELENYRYMAEMLANK